MLKVFFFCFLVLVFGHSVLIGCWNGYAPERFSFEVRLQEKKWRSGLRNYQLWPELKDDHINQRKKMERERWGSEIKEWRNIIPTDRRIRTDSGMYTITYTRI